MSLAGLTQRTVVTGEFAGWTGPVELYATDAADFVVGHVPVPGRDGVPFFDADFHIYQQKKSSVGYLEYVTAVELTAGSRWRIRVRSYLTWLLAYS